MSSSSSTRYANIDALRAVAALLVVWVHAGELFLPVAVSGRWLYDAAIVINAGRIGVTVFFLVSGFVIPSSLDRGGPKLSLVTAFAIRRFFRLYPIYWLSVLAEVLVEWLARGILPSPLIIFANLSMLHDAFGVRSLQWVYWTLLTELVFYVLCVVLFLAGILRRNSGVAAASGIALAAFLFGYTAGADGTWLGAWEPHRRAGNLSLMFLGALLRRGHEGHLNDGISRVATMLLAVFWLAGAALLTRDASYAIGLVIFLAGAFALRSPWRGLVMLGGASYSLYLFHAVLFTLLACLVTPGGLSGAPLFVYALIGAALAIGLAFVLFRWA